MAKSFDELIDWLLGEIVFGGDEGISVSQFLNLVDKYYSKDDVTNSKTSAKEVGVSDRRKPNTDHVFKSMVWQWLVARPDIYVGDDREGNKLTLDQVLALPASRPKAVISDVTASASDTQDLTPDVHSHPSTALPQVEGTLQVSTPTTSPIKHSIRTPKSKPSMLQPRIQVSQDRQWRELTGHGIDTKKVPVSEWRLLCTIAATRANGIAQGELCRASGQDKRSVPRRTDFLAQKGYIEKRQILLRNQKTSLLTHIKFVDESHNTQQDDPMSDPFKIPASVLTADLSPIACHSQWTGGFVDEEALVRSLIAVLRAWGVMQYTHLRQKLHVHTLRWQMKVLARNTRRLVSMGIVQRVDAKLGHSEQVYKDCVKMGREMTEEDWAAFRKKPTSRTDKGRPREDVRTRVTWDTTSSQNVDEMNDVENDSGEEEEESGAKSLKATKEGTLWTPHKPVGNILYDAIHAAGTDGLSGMQARKIITGDAFEKPMYRWLDAYSQSESQPVHLDHLSIIRDVSQTGKNNHYQYFTLPNFQKLVDEGRTSWENVRHQSATSAVVDLDSYGFSKFDPTIFQGPDGRGTLLEATLAADRSLIQRRSHKKRGPSTPTTPTSAPHREPSDPLTEPRPRGRPPLTRPRGRPSTNTDPFISSPLKPRGRPPKNKAASASPMPDQQLDPLQELEPPKKRRKVEEKEGLRLPPDPNKLHKAVFTSFDDMQREEGVPRVYIAPTGSERFSRIGRQGRPPRSLVAVFKSERLREFGWMYRPAPPVKVRALVGNAVGLVSSEDVEIEDSIVGEDEEVDESIVVDTGASEERQNSITADSSGDTVVSAESPALLEKSVNDSPSIPESLKSPIAAELQDTAPEQTGSISSSNISAPSKILDITAYSRVDSSQLEQIPHIQQPADKVLSNTQLPQLGVPTTPVANSKKRKTEDDSEKARSAKKIALTEAVRALGSAPSGMKAKQVPPKTPYRSPYDLSSYKSPFQSSPLANEVKMDRPVETPVTPQSNGNASNGPSSYKSPFAAHLSNLGAGKSVYMSPMANTSEKPTSTYKSPYATSTSTEDSSRKTPSVPTKAPTISQKAIETDSTSIPPAIEMANRTSAAYTTATFQKSEKSAVKQTSDEVLDEEQEFTKSLKVAAATSLPENADFICCRYEDVIGNLILSIDKTKVTFIKVGEKTDSSKILDLEISHFSKPPTVYERKSKQSEIRIYTNDEEDSERLYAFRISRSTSSHDAANIIRAKIVTTMTMNGVEMPPPKSKYTKRPAPNDQGKPYLCEKCGGRWRNDNGLQYHLEKSNGPCNPSWVPKPHGWTKSRSKSTSVGPGQSPVVVPDEEQNEGTHNDTDDQHEDNVVISDDEDDDLYELTPSGKAVPQNKRRRTTASARPSITTPSPLPAPFSIPARMTPWELHGVKITESDVPLKSVETFPSPNKILPPTSKSRMQNHTPALKKTITKEKLVKTNPAVISAQRRKDTILELLDACGGVFPGMKSLWFAFVGAWRKKFPTSGNPEMRVVNASAASLIDSGIIRKHEFAFRDKTGRMKTRVVLTKDTEPTAPVFVEMKKEVINAAPDFYVPEAFLPPKDLLAALEETASKHGDRAVSIKTAGQITETQPEVPKETNIETLIAPFYASVVPKEARRLKKSHNTTEDIYTENNNNSDEDGEFEEEDDDPYGMSTPLGIAVEEHVARKKRPWKPEDSSRRAKQSAILKAAWAARKAQGLSGKIEPGWKISGAIDYSQFPHVQHDSDSEYEENEVMDDRMDIDAGSEDEGPSDSLQFNGASFEIDTPEAPQKSDISKKQCWQLAVAFLQDSSGAWSKVLRPKRKRELRPQLPEPITLMQTLDNPAWGTHAFGHGVRPIYSRPARKVENNAKSDHRYAKLLRGHRPVLHPNLRVFGPVRQSIQISRPQNALAGAPPRQKRKYVRKAIPQARSAPGVAGVWQLQKPGPISFRPPVRPSQSANPLPLPHITAGSSRYLKFLEPNTALDAFDTPGVTYPVIASPQGAVQKPRFASANVLRQGEYGYWNTMPESVFELLDSSITIEGWMPSDGYFLTQKLPEDMDAVMKTKSGKPLEWETKMDPHMAKFLSEVETTGKWEIKDMQIILQGTMAPEYRWIQHSTRMNLQTPELVPSVYDFHPQEQLSWSNPPWDDESNYPLDEEINSLEPHLPAHHSKRPKVKKTEIQEASQKAKDRRAMMAKFKTRRLTQLPQDADFLDKDVLDDGTQIAWDYKPAHGNRAENTMSEEDDRRLIVAVIVVRTLTGGYEKSIDWVLVARLFPHLSLSFVNKRWVVLYKKHRLAIEKLSVEFPEFFLEAYATDNVPPFDPDNALAYDWAYVVDWVLSRDDVSLQGNHSIRLPETRGRLNTVFNISPKDSDPRWRDVLYGAAPIHRRVDLLTARAHTIPVKRTPQHKPVSTSLDSLTIARSVIRANCLTPTEVYNGQAALTRMNSIGDAVIKKALNQMLTVKILMQKNKGRPMPGRAYDTTDAFEAVFRRDVRANMLERAAQFKGVLDMNFRADRTVLIDYSAADGDILAITNLQAHGRIRLVPSDVPMNKFGLTDGDYMVRQMDKSRLRFKMTVVPTERYIYDEDISFPREPPHHNDAVPLWFDVHGKVNLSLWRKVMAGVFGLLALRSGANMRDLIAAFAPSLEEWELRLLVEWGVEIGVLRVVEGGWDAGEWWWWVAGRD